MAFVKNTFRDWWRSLSAEQKRLVARRCKTTVNYFDQIACGARALTVEMAAKVERVSNMLGGALVWPAVPVTRGDIHGTCARCPHFIGHVGENQ